MGAAEDVYRRRQDAAEARRLREDRELKAAALRDIQKYLPRAVESLRSRRYSTDFDAARTGIFVKMIVWNGEERVCWTLEHYSSYQGEIYGVDLCLLSDGVLVFHTAYGETTLIRRWTDLTNVRNANQLNIIASKLKRIAECGFSLRAAFMRPQLEPTVPRS
jgi:hypothetical protein